MKIIILLLSVLLFILSCSTSIDKKENNTNSDSISISKKFDFDSTTNIETETIPNSIVISSKPQNLIKNYRQVKQSILEYRNKLAIPDTMNDSFNIELGKYLYKQLLNEIIPFWYGTPWDFNGYTDVPNDGHIACGYFVSTTLKHLGFNLNRYKLAQQYSLKIIEILCDSDEIKTWAPEEFGQMLNYIQKREPDVYLVGLTCHVGYLSLENDTVYFIHSSYMEPYCVIKEYADLSEVLKSSHIFVTGPLFKHTSLCQKWLTKDTIAVK